MRCKVLILFAALAMTGGFDIAHAADDTLWSVDIQGAGSALYGQLDPPALMEGVEPEYDYGNIWNGFDVPGHDLPAAVNPSMELVDSEGNATSVTFTITGNVSGFSYADVVPLIQDYLFVNAGNSDASLTWSITALEAGGSYELYAYGGIARDVSITIDTDGDGSLADETATIVPGAGFLFESVKADSNGTIIGRTAPGTVAEGNWGGFQLRQNIRASRPNPADGAENVIFPLFEWKPGGTAKFHDVYFGTNPTPGAAEFKISQPLAWAMYYHLEPLIPGTTYYWRIDEVEADGTIITGDVWSFTAAPLAAYGPNPPDGAKWVDIEADLSWTAGVTADSHDVYLGTDETAVADGTGGTLKGNEPDATYDPGSLAKDTAYYWRIDEVESNGTTKHKGDVWSFTTLPDIPITDPNLVAWWKLDEGEGTTVLDWSGHGHHGTLIDHPQWVPGYDGGALELDGADDWVDFGNPPDLPSGTSARSISAWAKTDSVAGGYRVPVGYGSPAGSQAMCFAINGDTLYGSGYGNDLIVNDFWEVGVWYHLCLTYDGTTARLYADGIMVISEAKDWNLVLSRVRIGRQVNEAAEFWDGLVDDVRIYSKMLTQDEIKQAMRGDPLLAWNPAPANWSTPDVEHAIPLSWSPGDKAAKHDVYLGTDETAVEDADTTTTGIYRGRLDPNSYTPPEALDWGQTYYWRIDEYNTDATVSEGRVWRFTVADYLLVDDFEPYDDYCNRIFYAWPDGWGHSGDVTCGVVPYGGNGTGSTVGYLAPPYAEQTIVHGGRQSMPLEYLNDGSTGKALYSETERTFELAQDWTREDVKSLTLWFRGYPASVGSFSYDPVTDIYTMTADGADIWGTSDEFHCAFKRLSGVGIIEAQVLSVQNTDGWAKAGVMIRETLDPNSIHAMVVVTPSQGVSFQRRTATSGGSDQTTEGGIKAPHWVKLERGVGSVFTAYHSADGSAWTQLGNAVNIVMQPDVYIGLALTSHNTDPTVACTATFSDVTVTGAATGQWQSQDIGIASNDAEQLYVALEDTTGKSELVNHPDPNAVQVDTWQPWDIPLKDFSDAGVNLASIKKMYIGLGDRDLPKLGGAGMLYVDDIRLYPSRCLPSLGKPDADFSGNCVVDYPDLKIMANEWLVDANDLQADLNLDSEVNFKDYAGLADTWLDVLLWP